MATFPKVGETTAESPSTGNIRMRTPLPSGHKRRPGAVGYKKRAVTVWKIKSSVSGWWSGRKRWDKQKCDFSCKRLWLWRLLFPWSSTSLPVKVHAFHIFRPSASRWKWRRVTLRWLGCYLFLSILTLPSCYSSVSTLPPKLSKCRRSPSVDLLYFLKGSRVDWDEVWSKFWRALWANLLWLAHAGEPRGKDDSVPPRPDGAQRGRHEQNVCLLTLCYSSNLPCCGRFPRSMFHTAA